MVFLIRHRVPRVFFKTFYRWNKCNSERYVYELWNSFQLILLPPVQIRIQIRQIQGNSCERYCKLKMGTFRIFCKCFLCRRQTSQTLDRFPWLGSFVVPGRNSTVCYICNLKSIGSTNKQRSFIHCFSNWYLLAVYESKILFTQQFLDNCCLSQSKKRHYCVKT